MDVVAEHDHRLDPAFARPREETAVAGVALFRHRDAPLRAERLAGVVLFQEVVPRQRRGPCAHVEAALRVRALVERHDARAVPADVAGGDGERSHYPRQRAARAADRAVAAVQQRGWAGPGVEARRLLDLLSGHAGLGGNRVERERLEAGDQFVPALRAPVDEVHVRQPVVDDAAQDAAEQHGVGAGVRPQPERGVPGELDLARIDDDELLRPGADGALDRHADHVLLFSKVCTHHHDGGGVRQLPHVHRSGEVTERVLQPLDDAGAVVRRHVDTVRAHHDSGELLRRVELLVGVTRVRHEREGGAAMRREALGGGGDRLVPRGLLQLTVPAHQRLPDAALVVDVLEPELALEARLPQVRRGVQLRHRAHDALPVVDLVGHRAADRALGADRLLDARRALPLVGSLGERSHGADVDARAAELAAGLQQRVAHHRADEHLARALRHAYRDVAAQFVARPRAARADDAEVVVAVVERVLGLHLQVAVLVRER